MHFIAFVVKMYLLFGLNAHITEETCKIEDHSQNNLTM
jgi:hypothetical protein